MSNPLDLKIFLETVRDALISKFVPLGSFFLAYKQNLESANVELLLNDLAVRMEEIEDKQVPEIHGFLKILDDSTLADLSDSNLRKMFVELLAKTADGGFEDTINPSFSNVLKNMDRESIAFIAEVLEIGTDNFRFVETNSQLAWKVEDERWIALSKQITCGSRWKEIKEIYPILSQFGLVDYQKYKSFDQESIMDSFEYATGHNHWESGGMLYFTPFGRAFLKAIS